MSFWAIRRARKQIQELVHHVDHYRAYHEDILKKSDLERLHQLRDAAKQEAAGKDVPKMEQAFIRLHDFLLTLSPLKQESSLRENLEVLVVAIAVAMAFRAYLLQPFKIPTGSMQPTLNGITSHEQVGPKWADHFPLYMVKWLITGEWYYEVRVKESGKLSQVDYPQKRPALGKWAVRVGWREYHIPKGAGLQFKFGDPVPAGAILWSGVVTAGDHVFVNKVAWNFRKPTLGEVMVFKTQGITAITEGSHYIKRMCGLPGDLVTIEQPELLINGKRVMDCAPIRKIAEGKSSGGMGYHLAMGEGADYLNSSQPTIKLKDKEYLALGDNTRNSRDSRYWGVVPRDNLVGPACIVYWPFSERWGVIR